MAWAPKKIFINTDGEAHFGVTPPEDNFVAGTKEEIEKILSTLSGIKLWRCNVCNDLHIGIKPPKICPTCLNIDAYVETDLQEFKIILETLS